MVCQCQSRSIQPDNIPSCPVPTNDPSADARRSRFATNKGNENKSVHAHCSRCHWRCRCQMGDGALKIKFRAPAHWLPMSLGRHPASERTGGLALGRTPAGSGGPSHGVRVGARRRGAQAAASRHQSPSERCRGRGWKASDAGCSPAAAGTCERPGPTPGQPEPDPGAPTWKHTEGLK